MSSNAYHFITHWRVRGTLEDVNVILHDAMAFPHWWPAVYRNMTLLDPGKPDGVGRVIETTMKGWLPFSMRVQFRVTESRNPYGFTLAASGDLVGRGIWTLAQEGDFVAIAYEWSVLAEKPLLRYLSFVLKPMFAANHDWAMARGEESLRLELLRRYSKDEAERAAVPPPPAPTFVRFTPAP
jgi:hypothetical protein